MPSKKFKGIWPLPGGIRNHVLTLRKILGMVKRENQTMEQLASWLRSEYNLSGKTAPYGYLRVVKDKLGFLQKSGDRLRLTPIAADFLRTGDNSLLLETLRERILGFDEVLSLLSEGQRLDLTEIHEELLRRCNVEWKKTHQAMFRLNWLLSLGYVERKHGKYYLTNEGNKAIGEVKGKEPLPPPSTPIDDYIKHSTELVESYPTMSESNTTSTLIEPLLDVLGWNTRDLGEVQRQYQVHVGRKTEYVDIALKFQNKPVVFIEAKSADTTLHDHLAEQPMNYAINEGVSWCVLMNGLELKVYNAFWRIKGIEQKMFLKLSIGEFREKIDKLELLSKKAITSGRLDEEGELEHAKRMILEWLKQKENFVVKDIKELDPSLKEEYVRRVLREIQT